jgi:uncharacterized protein YbjT (DUF2867 family)
MRIVLVGATGFIGARLRTALRMRGHRLLLVSRSRPAAMDDAETWLRLDLATPVDPAALDDALQGADALVNAAGIVRESAGRRFADVHDAGPRALFDASLRAGMRRVVQVSALGADADARTAFHLSKRAADEHLLSLPVAGVVAQPSLVFGGEGASSRLFLSIATWPLLPLPGGGEQAVQPIHVDDLMDALVALVEDRLPTGRVALVGPRPLTLREYLQALRRGLGLAPARVVALPRRVGDLLARLGDRLEGLPLDSERWSMLQRGNVAPAADTARLLGRPPRPPEDFVPRAAAAGLRTLGQLAWTLPLLRLAVALVWLVTGVVSLGVFPVAQSHELLARAGVPEALRPLALYGAAALDLAFGALSLAPRRPAWLWTAQAALILAYTLIISVRLPEFWLHPYGPILKNLPMLAALLLLARLDRPEARSDHVV